MWAPHRARPWLFPPSFLNHLLWFLHHLGSQPTELPARSAEPGGRHRGGPSGLEKYFASVTPGAAQRTLGLSHPWPSPKPPESQSDGRMATLPFLGLCLPAPQHMGAHTPCQCTHTTNTLHTHHPHIPCLPLPACPHTPSVPHIPCLLWPACPHTPSVTCLECLSCLCGEFSSSFPRQS